MKISVVLGYRDRDSIRVKRCFESLRDQGFTNFEIVFVDYGSIKENSETILNLIKEFPALDINYVYVYTEGWYWNRSHALNIGIKQAKGEIIFFGDVDFLYPSETMGYVAENLRSNQQIHSYLFYLNETFDKWDQLFYNNSDFHKRQFGDFIRDSKGSHAIFKKALKDINGYDEFYCIWGVEDRDLSTRLEVNGLETVWLDDDKFTVYHQWHPTVNNKHHFFPSGWMQRMELHFLENRNRPKRNPNGWGKMIEKAERPILKMIDNEEFWSDCLIRLKRNSFSLNNFQLGLIDLLETKGKVRVEYELRSSNNPFIQMLNRILNLVIPQSSKIDLTAYVNNLSLRKFLISARPDKFFDMEKEVIAVVWYLIFNKRLKDHYLDFTHENKVVISLFA
ncbi:glycosyltransferase [Marinoscillum sp. MHG1-6]|uniref:glycosyltransferase family 2 protein n=1 Tax=Marinoscillum sp. MHG1-6 TaxID=2959627 RepID=UPI0021580E0A|nr:glycosyltransferase [Marinoscillum sp. MHG1-6]